MQRFAIYVEVDGPLLTADILGNFITAIPGVDHGQVFAVADDDTITGLGQHLSVRRYQRRLRAALARDEALFKAGEVCLASVTSSYSYRSHPCGKPAKAVREVTSGEHCLGSWEIGPNPAIPVCGIHNRDSVQYLRRYYPDV